MNRRLVLRRAMAAVAAGLLAACATRVAWAQPTPAAPAAPATAPGAPERPFNPAARWAAVSLFGNEVHLVQRRNAIGTQITRNIVDKVSVGGLIDKTALDVLQPMLQLRQAVVPSLLTAVAPSVHSDQQRFHKDGKLDLPEPFMKAMLAQGATHVLLITRHQGEARFEFNNSFLGDGILEGVGFYVDPLVSVRNVTTNESSTGFVGVYAYMRLTVADLASLRVLKHKELRGNLVWIHSLDDKGNSAWDALSTPQKIDLLKDLVTDELKKAVPSLLQLP